MDGWVVIETKLDTKQLEADLKNAKKELTQFQKEEEKLLKEKGKIELNLSAYDEEKAKIKETTQEMLNQATTKSQTKKMLELEKFELEEIKQKYSKQFSSLEKINNELKNNQLQQGLINNEIDEIDKKLSQAKGYDNVSNQMGKIKDQTTSVVKQVGKWALAIFSVRSIYSFLSRASSTLAQYNKEYGANLEYIRFALAQAIAPVLQFIVNLSFKLLNLINSIVQALFGVNLFSKASVKDFQKMSGSAASIKKSLQTAGFDEMNVLSDSSSGGGGGFTSPTMDITQMEQITFETITRLLDKTKEVVGATFDTIIENVSTVLTDFGFSEKFVETFQLAAEGVKRVFDGLIDTIKGVLEIIWGLLSGDAELVRKGFKDLLLGISEILSGAVQAIIGIIKLIWLALVDIFTPVAEWIYKYVILPVWNFIKALFDTIVSIIKTAFSVISGIFKALVEIMKAPFTALKLTVESVISGARTTIMGFRDLFRGIFTGDMKMALEGFKNIFRGVFESLWGIAKYPLNLIIGGINALIDGANKIKFDVPDWVPGLGGQKWGFNISKIPMLKTGAIINNPSYGVPVGGGRALAGEAGAEGIIPLTDSQAMETLGEAIGRYITINANIVNSMNGRTISRELQRIRGNQDFAYNK